MQETKWVFAFASTIGNSHISEQLPCQDYCRVETYDNFNICVVCDGAGSCENSQVGSEFVSQVCIYHFEKAIKTYKWDSQTNLPNQEMWHEIAKQTLLVVRDDLEKYSINHNLLFKSLACTIIVAITIENGLLVTHIGDGRAGYCNMENEWFPLITPLHGIEANETAFITSAIWGTDIIDNYIESCVVDNNVKAFCLLSDGCEKAAFECNLYDNDKKIFFDPNRPFPLFFNPNVSILPKFYQEGKTQDEINLLWSNFLTAGNEKLKNEPDDKTLILGVLITNVPITESNNA